MIFKTITDDVTGANKSIGLFGLSLDNLASKLNNIKTNGLKSTIFDVPTIDYDEKAIKIYNQQLTYGRSSQVALAIASKNTNKETIALMKSANGAAISTEQLTAVQKASTIAAKAQSAALKGLSVAGNMIAMWAISEAISFAVNAFDELANSAEHTKERAEGFSATMEEFRNEASERLSKLCMTMRGILPIRQKTSVNVIPSAPRLSNIVIV